MSARNFQAHAADNYYVALEHQMLIFKHDLSRTCEKPETTRTSTRFEAGQYNDIYATASEMEQCQIDASTLFFGWNVR